MIQTGRTQTLTILRDSSVGLFLGNGADGEVLLPNKYVPERFELGEPLEVFVYRDHADRQVATTLVPKVHLDGHAVLRVFDVGPLGAFVEWGMEKHLLIPFREQERRMEAGRWYVVRMLLDASTDRLYGTARIDRHLDNSTLTVAAGDAVQLMVFDRSDLGWSVIVNDRHQGMLHASDVFRPISIGDRLEGHVKKVRDDLKLDITLQPPGFLNYNDGNVALLAKHLQRTGHLDLTDKSSPEDIHAVFGISKKAFKQAVGTLYRERQVRLDPDGIVWLGPRS